MPKRVCVSLVFLAALVLALVRVEISRAAPEGEVVVLPDGDAVLVGAEGQGLLQAHDAGGLEPVLWQLVDEGRASDAMAVLGYVARHRKAAAGELAVMGLRIVTDLQDVAGAGLVVDVIRRESGADPATMQAAVQAAGMPASFVGQPPAASLERASLETASRFLPGPIALPAAAETTPADEEVAPASAFGGNGNRGGGRGRIILQDRLPPGLTLGFWWGRFYPPVDVKDPPADGGVS